MSSTTASEKQNQMQLGFAAVVGSLSFVVSAALPPLAFLLLSCSALSIMLYRHQWDAITANQTPIDLDKSSLALMGIAVMIVGFVFMPLELISKMLLCGISGAGIGYFFANQCVLKSQITLNIGLIEATKDSNIEDINRLLKLGADPFAPDALGNCAIHHSIQHHKAAPSALTSLLQKGLKTDHSFNRLLTHAKTLFTDDNIRQQWSAGWQSLKTCFQHNNAENRVLLSQAAVRIFDAYVPVLKKCLNTLSRYLRETIAYPKDLNCQNNRGATALDILNTVKVGSKVKNALQKILVDAGVKPGIPKTMQPAIDEKVEPPTPPVILQQETLVHNKKYSMRKC